MIILGLGCFTIGSVGCGRSPSGGGSEFEDLYRPMQNLLKLFDFHQGAAKIYLPSMQSHHALTIRHYKSGVVTSPADTERTRSHSWQR